MEAAEKPYTVPHEAQVLLDQVVITPEGPANDAGPAGDQPDRVFTLDDVKPIAAGMVEFARTEIGGVHPAFAGQFTAPTMDKLTDRLAAVLHKYQMKLPEWLERILREWKEEISLGMAIGGVAWGCYKAYRAYEPEPDNQTATPGGVASDKANT